MQFAAIGIALGYGLLTFVLLGRRRLRQPWLLASLFRWDMDTYSTSLGIGLLGIVIAAIVNEILKLVPALLTWSLGEERGDALVFGAAAGAGFGVVGAHQVIVYALIAHTLPIGSAVGFASALVQQFAFVAAHTAATALAAYGASRHRIAAFLAAAIGAESTLGALALLFSLRIYSGPVWTLAMTAAGIGGLLLAYTLVVSGGGRPRARL